MARAFKGVGVGSGTLGDTNVADFYVSQDSVEMFDDVIQELKKKHWNEERILKYISQTILTSARVATTQAPKRRKGKLMGRIGRPPKDPSKAKKQPDRYKFYYEYNGKVKEYHESKYKSGKDLPKHVSHILNRGLGKENYRQIMLLLGLKVPKCPNDKVVKRARMQVTAKFRKSPYWDIQFTSDNDNVKTNPAHLAKGFRKGTLRLFHLFGSEAKKMERKMRYGG